MNKDGATRTAYEYIHISYNESFEEHLKEIKVAMFSRCTG